MAEEKRIQIVDVEFKGDPKTQDVSKCYALAPFNSTDPETKPKDLETMDGVHVSGDVLVTKIDKKRKVLVEAAPAVIKVDEETGEVVYEEVKGKKLKTKVKQEPDDNDQILVQLDGDVTFNEPIVPEQAAVIFKARPAKPLWPLILLLILLIAGLILGLIILLDPWGDPRAKKGYYEGKTQEEIQNDLNQDVAWYSMMMSVAPYVVVSPGSTFCPELNVENIEANHCDQKFTFKLKDNGEVLYESGAIKPGEYIPDVEMSRSFEEGVYEGIVEFQGYEQQGRIGGDGQIWGHDKFGAPASFEVLIIVTDDMATANATAKHYLE